MITPKDTAIVGAFLMEGIRDSGDYVELLDRWGDGCYGIVAEVTKYAELIHELAEIGGSVTGDFPGVYDYEVTSVFGCWFASEVRYTGELPTARECYEKALELAGVFFVGRVSREQFVNRAGYLMVE